MVEENLWNTHSFMHDMKILLRTALYCLLNFESPEAQIVRWLQKQHIYVFERKLER